MKRISSFRFQISIALLLLLTGCGKNNGSDSPPTPIDVPVGALTLTVQPQNLQEVKGWGIYPGHTLGHDHINANNSITAVPAARKALLEDLGVNIFRVEIVPRAGENYTAANKTLSTIYLDDLAALINDAKDRGVTRYLISIWSPPYHMKEVYDAGSEGSHNYRPRLKKNQYDLFVEYVKDALLYLKNAGCPLPEALSLQNEPEAGVVATADDVGGDSAFIDGLDLMILLGKMRTALNGAGLSAVKLAAPESPSYAGSWILRWSAVGPLSAQLLEPVDIHAIHSYVATAYDNNTPEEVEAPLAEFLDFKRKIGGESWQTEFCVTSHMGVSGDTHLKRLMITMRMLASDMVHAGHTVWMWWCGWFPGWSIDSPDQQVIVGGNGVTSATKSQMFEALATIFNSVPPGSHVRKVVTNDPALKTNARLMNDLAAFQTPTGTFILLVNGNAPKTYYVGGLTGTAGTLKSLSGDDAKTVKTSDLAVSNGMAKVSVPGNSVNFIFTY